MLNRYFLAVGGVMAALMMHSQPSCGNSCTDSDGDGYCSNSSDQTDCDDFDTNVHPGAAEICDGKDDDCNGALPLNEYDNDQDGYRGCQGDCDDANAAVNPKASEVCDGKDDNCDGTIPTNELDADKDKYSSCQGDCDDADVSTYPGAAEACDGKDNNCDGSIPANELDSDHDSFTGCKGDCDDKDASSYPGGQETCDGRDQNCDGVADAVIGTSSAWVRSVCGAVLKASNGVFEANGDDQPSVLYNPDKGVYQMWYRGVDLSGNSVGRIGYAESKDSVTWTKHLGTDGQPAPVLDLGASGSWDALRIGFPSVTYAAGVYTMYYQGQDASNILRIGLASSTDGLNWVRSASNPVLTPGATGTWDAKAIQAPSVLFDSAHNTWKMWYTGSDGTLLQTGYAESTDGKVWTKASSNPVVKAGATGTWDSKRVVFPRVKLFNGLYQMWYSGDDTSNSFTYEIGYAYSSDGITWTKLPTNPVFSFGATSSFDSFSVYASDVTPVGNAYSMFYSGGTTLNGPYAVGLAKKASPEATLVAPLAGSTFKRGETVDFQLQVRETGDTDSVVSEFYSDRDGLLGAELADPTGRIDFSSARLSAGPHNITIISYDEGGLVISSQVQVLID